MREEIKRVLIELGITPNLKGFDYICEAVEIITNSKEKPKTMEIYEEIAERFNSTYLKVERCIRFAIDKIDTESNEYKKYIGTYNRTNSVVLYTLSYRLQDQMTPF